VHAVAGAAFVLLDRIEAFAAISVHLFPLG